MNKGETRYKINGKLEMLELTCTGYSGNICHLKDQHGKPYIQTPINVDRMMLSRVIAYKTLEEILLEKLASVKNVLKKLT